MASHTSSLPIRLPSAEKRRPRFRDCLRLMGLPLVVAIVCAAGSPALAAREVIVSIPPQASIVEAIAGEKVDVQVLVEPGRDPHTFTPTPKQVVALGRAEIYFSIGLPFEQALLQRIASGHSRMTIVESDAGIEKRMMVGGHHHPDGHSPAKEHQAHTHHTPSTPDPGTGTPSRHPDPHIWLSPPLLEEIARNTADGLIAADSTHRGFYQANLEELVQRIGETHQRITRILAPYRGESLFVFHPAFGYFADAYGLEQVAVEIEGKDPSPRELAVLIKRARAENARVIFVQPQFDPKSAQAIAESIDGAVVPLDPLARDILKNLESIAREIEQALDK